MPLGRFVNSISVGIVVHVIESAEYIGVPSVPLLSRFDVTPSLSFAPAVSLAVRVNLAPSCFFFELSVLIELSVSDVILIVSLNLTNLSFEGTALAVFTMPISLLPTEAPLPMYDTS